MNKSRKYNQIKIYYYENIERAILEVYSPNYKICLKFSKN